MTRYRQTMTEALQQVQLSEKEIHKLKNGVKVLGNALPNRAMAQKAADKANKEMGHDADVYQSPFNNRFYVRIKEDVKESEDHEISMARGELEAIADKALKLSSMLQGKSDADNLEAWVQSKITKAKDYVNSVADYMQYNPEMKEGMAYNFVAVDKKGLVIGFSSDEKDAKDIARRNDGEVKKLKKPMSDKKGDMMINRPFKEEDELEEGYEKVVLNALKKKGLSGRFSNGNLYVDKGDEKAAKDAIDDESSILKAPKIIGEQLDESFNDAQMKALKKAYEPLRGKKISVDNANKLGAMFTKFDKDKNALEKLYGADIPFVSVMAMTRLMTKHNYKAADLKKIRKESVDLADELEMLEEAQMLNEAEATIHVSDKKKRDNLVHLCKQVGIKTTVSGNKVHLKGIFRRVMDISLAMQRNGLKVEEKGKDDAYAIGMAQAKKMTGDEKPLKKSTIKKGHEIAKSIMKDEETIVEFTSQQIKMAYGVANDKRYKGGNYTGAVAAIEKIAKGLSKHPDVQKVLQRTNEQTEHPAKMKYEEIKGLRKKAEKSGMPYGILKKVYDRGMAAWRGGHRPGASQQQWAFARVNSFVTKSSGTWGGADKDLAAKVRGSK